MSFDRRIQAFVRFAVAASRKALSLPADVIFATSTPLTIAIPGLIAAGAKRIPMVFEVRDLWPDVPIAMGILTNPLAIAAARFLESITYRRASRIVTVAPGMKTSLVQRGIPESKFAVIPNGCDFDVFGNGDHRPVQFPADASTDIKILYLGTMGRANGVDYIPHLARSLIDLPGAPAVRFYLIGDGSERRQVERLAAELGVLNERLHFVGTLSKHDVARWVASVDATIITYDGPEIVYRDSVSNKFFDSIAAGKPVIANYRGFATETAAKAGAGFIVSRDPATAAHELTNIFNDPRIMECAGQRARTLAREHFGRDDLAAQLEKVLLEVTRAVPVARRK